MKLFSKLLSIIYIGVMLFLIAFFTMIQLGRESFPLQLKTVLSGSMAQSFPQDSLIIVKKGKISNLKVGNIITFEKNQDEVSHRITDIKKRGNEYLFETKGDSNSAIDSDLVDPKAIKGKVLFSLPKVGRVLLIIQTQAGRIASVLTFLDLILLEQFIRLLFASQKESKSIGIKKVKR